MKQLLKNLLSLEKFQRDVCHDGMAILRLFKNMIFYITNFGTKYWQ